MTLDLGCVADDSSGLAFRTKPIENKNSLGGVVVTTQDELRSSTMHDRAPATRLQRAVLCREAFQATNGAVLCRTEAECSIR